MPTVASGTFITALKASLAAVNPNPGWAVLGVSDTVVVTPLNAVGIATSFHSGQAWVLGAPVPSVTTETMTVTLSAANLLASGPAPTPLSLIYVSTWIGGNYSSGEIFCNGADLTTTDSALDATIRTLAAAFQAAQDAAAGAILNAGPTTPNDPLIIPPALLTKINNTLANIAAGWAVIGRSESHITVPNVSPAKPPTIQTIVAITLLATNQSLAVGSQVPGQFVYLQTLDVSGNLLEASVILSGTQWRTSDGTLRTAITNLAATFLTNQATNFENALP